MLNVHKEVKLYAYVFIFDLIVLSFSNYRDKDKIEVTRLQ